MCLDVGHILENLFMKRACSIQNKRVLNCSVKLSCDPHKFHDRFLKICWENWIKKHQNKDPNYVFNFLK